MAEKVQGVNEQDYVGFGISKTTGRRHDINHLPENPVWEEGVYQYEQNDKLIGGVDGIDNLQGQQLTNRTAYLKAKLEEQGMKLEEIAGVYGVSITIPKEGWTAEENGEYACRLDIDDEAITEDMTPLLIFAVADTKAAHECGIGDACETLAGKLRVYAMKAPSAAIAATLYLFGKASGASGANLPIASKTRAGVVKIGDNVDVTDDGTISVSESAPLADENENGIPDAIKKSMASPSEVKAALDGVFDD